VLPRDRRVTDARDFRDISRRGRRASSRTVVVHLSTLAGGGLPRAGFVVGKAVGNSVVRHRVVRRLRHQTGPLLASLPEGTSVVVRALPAAGSATSQDLAVDLRSCLADATRSRR